MSVSLSLLMEDPNSVMTREEDNVNDDDDDSLLDNGMLVAYFIGCRTSVTTNGYIGLAWSSSWMDT